MNRQQKEGVIHSLKAEMAGDSAAAFLVQYKGITVAQMLDLRKKLRSKGGTFKVAKVTLMKQALNDAPWYAQLEPLLKDQVGLVFAAQDPIGVAKILCTFAKDNAQVSIVAGCVDAAIINPQKVAYLASLPSREVLYAQLCWALKAPMYQLVRTLTLIKEKKEQESAQPEPAA
jgi:large subunit ribosomal protein L10